MFPSHDAVVTAVAEYERYPLLDELETSTDAFAAPGRRGLAGRHPRPSMARIAL